MDVQQVTAVDRSPTKISDLADLQPRRREPCRLRRRRLRDRDLDPGQGAWSSRDGIGRQRRERTYNRATHGLSRLVIMATTGPVTVEAHGGWTSWHRSRDARPVDRGGHLGTIRVANDDARLRRAQALAPGTKTGLEIARYLIGLEARRPGCDCPGGLGACRDVRTDPRSWNGAGPIVHPWRGPPAGGFGRESLLVVLGTRGVPFVQDRRRSGSRTTGSSSRGGVRR